MPANQRSFAVTDAYRDRLGAIRERTERLASGLWPTIETLDETDWVDRMAPALAQAQVEAVRVSAAYLQAFVSSEIGRPVRGSELDSREYAGVSRDGRPMVEALQSPLIGTLKLLKEGRDPDEAIEMGRTRALRMVEQSLMHAARASLSAAMQANELVEGWQRGVKGTCGACAGDIAIEVSVNLPGVPLLVHPNCQCVTVPVVTGVRNLYPLPTGEEIFDRMTRQEQDEGLGPVAAGAIRSGEVGLADLVAESPLETQENFLTQRPVSALS